MDMDAFTKGSKVASKASGKKQDSAIVCWFPNDTRSKGTTTVESRKATAWGRAKWKSSKANATSVARQFTCQRIADPKKRVHSKLATSWQRQLCIGMASVDLNALEIGAVQLPEKDHRIRIGIDPCAAVTVSQECFGRLSDARHARKNEELETSGRQASSRSGCAKSPSQGQGRVSQVREPQSCGRAQIVDGGVRDERHGTRCLLLKEQQRHQVVRLPREQRHETGAQESEQCVRVASRNCPIQPEYIEEQHMRFVFFTFCS